MEVFTGMIIPEITEETNFWMIRAKKGFFYDEFISKKFIAIGWNSLRKSQLHENMTKEHIRALKEIIKEDYDEKRPGTALNKCINFCNEMKEKDLVMIVDKARISFAVVGEYFEDDNPKYNSKYEKDVHEIIRNVTKNNETKYECPYIKRRHITLLKEIQEDYFSPYLYKAVAVNRHSLSNVNDYASIILNSCFESYIYKDRLVVSFRVNKRDDINAIDLADFISSSAKLVTNEMENINDVVVKTSVHSPGDIIFEIVNYVSSHKFYVMLLYIAIFGGKAGNYELNSIISCIKSLINLKYEKEKKKLELKKLKFEGDLLEQQVIEMQLENAKKAVENTLCNTDVIVSQVAQSANSLEIEMPDAKVIEISKYIDKYKDQ